MEQNIVVWEERWRDWRVVDTVQSKGERRDVLERLRAANPGKRFKAVRA